MVVSREESIARLQEARPDLDISTIVEKVILRYVNTSSKLDELLKYVNVFGILFFIMFLLFC